MRTLFFAVLLSAILCNSVKSQDLSGIDESALEKLDASLTIMMERDHRFRPVELELTEDQEQDLVKVREEYDTFIDRFIEVQNSKGLSKAQSEFAGDTICIDGPATKRKGLHGNTFASPE